MINNNIRVRFAPSPTGYLHVGGLRTALYNYLFAKRNNGTFILRIEDTDRKRFVEGAVDNLISALKWCGLEFDEGPNTPGNYGPYMQSQRLDLYKEYSENLIYSGHAYYCFCTQERLESLREEQQRQKLPQAKYDKHCLHLTQEEIKSNLDSGKQHVIRLNVPADKLITFDDIIREKVTFNSSNIDDQVLIKGDGYPTYHLANVIDDHLMGITHVIRGEEWLSSTPKHILLYNFFKWEIPIFAHLPLLLNPDRSKLSKRQGDVSVEDYRAKGYLKEALVNFVALLGWNAGDDKEFYDMQALIDNFSLERVNKAGAVFDPEKLNWLNSEHLRKKEDKEILSMLKEEIVNSSFNIDNYSDNYLLKVIAAMKERVSFIREYLTKSPYFFEAPIEYDPSSIEKNWKIETALQMEKLEIAFSKISNPIKEEFENALNNIAEEMNIGKGKLIHPLRLAVSGMSSGPGVFDILSIIGKVETSKRIKSAIKNIKLK